jgi:hypothetical protein
MTPEEFDWPKALDALGGMCDLGQVNRVRKVLEVAGITGLPLHPLEVQQVEALRERATENMHAATAIEARARGQ